jgi:hypothetical protein
MGPFNGITAPLAAIGGGVGATGIAYSVLAIGAYYGIIMTEFMIKVVQEVGTINRHWLNWWDTFWFYNLNPAMQDMTRQLVVLDADQARAIGSFNDMLQRNRIIKQRFEQQIKSHSTERPGENVCVAGTLSGGMAQAGIFTAAYNAAAPVDMMPRSANQLGTPAAGGTAAETHARFENYVSRYCDPNENAGAAGCTVAGPYAGADRDVAGQIFQHETIDLKDPEVKKTVDDLIINIAEPFVRDPVPYAAFTSSAGQQYILENEAYKTQRQVIYDALYHVVARRAPTTNLSSFVVDIHNAAGVNLANISNPRRNWETKEMASGTGFIRPAHADTAAPPPASKNEVMNALVNEKPRDGKFATKQIDEPQNNSREAAIQAGIRTRQLSDVLDLMDRYSLIVAGQVGTDMKEIRPKDAKFSSQPMQ